ncbi:MAG TPA: PD-(D/E)XK nuclease family protein, partial [Candidatus Limnocylindrales bacterium]
EPDLIAAFEASWSNEGFVSREHEAARLEAGRAALRQFRAAQLQPGTIVPSWVEREFAFALGGDRIRGRFDRVDIVPVATASAKVTGELANATKVPAVLRADVVEPMLELLGPEEVTITDYKSSDVRDVAKARQRARDSLQLQIYAMGYEATTGRLPDFVQLQFLESGVIGRVAVEPKRLAKARAKIRRAAEGIRAGDFRATPDTLACTYCPYRDICPSSLAR